MGFPFFGLTPNDKEIYLEPIFILMYYMGFSHREAVTLPIWQRKWFIDRFVQEMKDSQGGDKSAHNNSPDARAMQGRSRSQVPAKLRRFT